MEIIVETAGEDTEQTDVLELIHDSWLTAGIKLFTRLRSAKFSATGFSPVKR